MQYCCRKTVTVPDAPSGKRSVGEDQRTTVNYHASATQHNTHQRLDAGEALEGFVVKNRFEGQRRLHAAC
ncbi:hypothetical protein EVAR_100756_1 [Eumeta japonica]|uniref:Uncharacterized protein n=1 Tax=Eumeta variegata TaxID=151549 RepID=A0A4C2ABG3_EUMVA|nr:hypothetical protein EVAR_100756_1 [Eumeta japonica]